MDIDKYNRLLRSESERIANYNEMVSHYYVLVDRLYRKGWGESYHLPPFAGTETLEEAQLAQQRSLAEEGDFTSGQRILDVGCGVGRPALAVARSSGAHVTGVNISAGQVEIARDLSSESGISEMVDFVHADAMETPFADGEFDGAYVLDAMCHAPDKKALYAEIARVIKPGGIFLGYDWFFRDGITDDEYEEYIEPICRTWALPYLISLGQLESCLAASGMTVEVVADAAHRGNIARNWDILDAAAQILTERQKEDPGERMIKESSESLARAGRAGCFVVGRWWARKQG